MIQTVGVVGAGTMGFGIAFQFAINGTKVILNDLSEEILEAVLGEGNVQILDTMPVKFQCTCSKERFGAAILSLGEKEIRDMIDEEGMAEAHCHFCEEKYHYSKEELEGFIEEIHEQKN